MPGVRLAPGTHSVAGAVRELLAAAETSKRGAEAGDRASALLPSLGQQLGEVDQPDLAPHHREHGAQILERIDAAAARLQMAPVSLRRWVGRRKEFLLGASYLLNARSVDGSPDP